MQSITKKNLEKPTGENDALVKVPGRTIVERD